MSEHCLIKKNTPELRKKLEDADWLSCWGSHMMYMDDLSKEAYLEMYLKETNPIVCESEDEFINMCKQFKRK